MDLVRHLRFFVAVAEEGHFGEAAARLEMTQPPVSQGLRRLEKELGVTLIRRTSRGAELTDAGRELLPRARVMIDDAGRFLGEARRLRTATDSLRWGTIPQIGAAAAASVAARLAADDRAQDMISAGAVALVDQVLAGVLDVAIIGTPCVTAGLISGPVVTFDRGVVIPADHPAASAARPRLRQLAGLALSHPPRSANPPSFDQLLDRFREQGLDPPLLATATEEESLAAVAGGRAFALGVAPGLTDHIDAVRTVSLAPDATALRVRVVHLADTHAETAEIITASLWKSALGRSGPGGSAARTALR